MKFFSLIILFFGLSVQAGPAAKSCNFEDNQKIVDALKTQEIRIGKKLKNEVLEIMSQEMAPSCIKIVGKIGISIPGQKMQEFEIDNNAGRAFKVTLISSMEEGKRFVVIERLAD